MKIFYLVFALIIAASACPAQDSKPINYVNPMIGTGGHGHTFPGATAPFGMVQLSPDTRLDGWDGCSAYHNSDSVVYGFSHTHLSGTGCSDYGDILLMPVAGRVKLNNSEYSSPFSHKNEIAKAGYYSVKLDKYNILAELTATKRVGVHRYTFSGDGERNLLIDLIHRDIVLNSRLQQLNDSVIVGFRHSKAWADNQMLFFAIKFSEKLEDFVIYNDKVTTYCFGKGINGVSTDTTKEGTKLQAVCTFKGKGNKPLEVYVALSAVSSENALMNLEAEMANMNFDKAKEQVQIEWNKELSKIIVEGKNENDKVKFYTALYHCMTQPNLYSDINGEYRGTDHKVHKADFDYYTVFSLWDTYRAYHPLMTIIDQKRTNNWIKTFQKQYDDGGILPVWELSGNETYCMIGYHSVPVIADAIMKGIGNFDKESIFKAMKGSAMKDHLGLKEYREYNFVPGDLEHESVSKTLEYCFDDWCISQVAKKLGKSEDYTTFNKRSQFYKNVFDPKTKFMRARFNGGWYKPFTPTEVNNNYTEGNSWQYSFYAPQDLNTLMDMYGGRKAFYTRLDEMFTTKAKVSGREQADLTGLIGQYAHGNEPSHHIAYLFNYVNNPNRTQELVRKIMNELYTTEPDGLTGNEDCGQMSAWFVMSAMGIYQVCPGDTNYILGSPLFDKVTINLENGKNFVINAKNNTEKNVYVQSAALNGKKYTHSYLSHFDIMRGGEFTLEMGAGRSHFAVTDKDCPKSRMENSIVLSPTIDAENKLFKGKAMIELNATQDNSVIFYTLDNTIPSEKTGIKYSKPFEIDKACTIKAVSFVNGKSSPVVSGEFVQVQTDKKIKLLSKYDKQYDANGDEGIIDGLRGNKNFRLGGWQGYQDQDFAAIVELEKPRDIKELALGCLQDTRSWIVYPTEVEFFVSNDGKEYKSVGTTKTEYKADNYTEAVEDFTVKCNVKAKYIKVVAKNFGTLPEWHLGAGGKAYIFVDEIIIK